MTTRGLFDEPTEPAPATSPQPQQEQTPLIPENPICPQCGGASLPTLRPADHDGHTHYCIGACGEYFTPKTGAQIQAEAFQNVTQETLQEIDRELGTQLADEPEQTTFIDAEHGVWKQASWRKEWGGMPEYENEDYKPYKTIKLHFDRREDLEAFCLLVNQRITLDTISIWYPEAGIAEINKLRYVDADKPVYDADGNIIDDDDEDGGDE